MIARQITEAQETFRWIGQSFGPVWALVFVLLGAAGVIVWVLLKKLLHLLERQSATAEKQSETWVTEVPKILAKNAEAQAASTAAIRTVGESIQRSDQRREEQHRDHVDAMKDVVRALERREK